MYKTDGFNESNIKYSLYHCICNGLGEIADIIKIREYANGAKTTMQERVGHYDYDPYGLISKVNTYEGYGYAEEVLSLPEKLNAAIPPWLQEKVSL